MYKTYPPKHGNWEKPKDAEIKKWKEMVDIPDKIGDVGKVLRAALASYHPDKIDEEEHGEKWKTLSEEIYKLLSAHYESTKLHF